MEENITSTFWMMGKLSKKTAALLPDSVNFLPGLSFDIANRIWTFLKIVRFPPNYIYMPYFYNQNPFTKRTTHLDGDSFP
jgi:hypothetical protein